MAKLLEIIIQGTSLTGMILNKFNLYSQTYSESGQAALSALKGLGYDELAPAAPVANSVLARFLDVCNNTADIGQLYARDPYNVFDFVQLNVTGAGWQGKRTAAGAYPAYVAKIKSSRTRQDIKAGFKVMPPLLASDILNNTALLAPAYLTLAKAFTDELSDGVDVPVGPITNRFGWCIVGKQEYETDSGKRAYRYYPTLTEQVEHLAAPVSWGTVERATTQNTRKFGKGR